MCIIAFKPAGVDMISEETIRRMFTKNPDGAGFAIQGALNGPESFVVKYEKGFMNIDDLLEALGPLDRLKDFSVAIHCRIKTSGEVDKATTHPFPLTSSYGEMRHTSGEITTATGGGVLFHNGVFSGLGGCIDKNSSDTQDFVAGVATRYLMNMKPLNKVTEKIVSNIISPSRVLVLYPKKKFPYLMFGNWVEDGGVYYSNSGYKEIPASTYSYSGYGGYSSWSGNSWNSTRGGIYDNYGRANSEFSIPSTVNDWIKTSQDHYEEIVEKATIKEVREDGVIIATFPNTHDKRWILDEENLEVYMEEKEEEVLERQAQEWFCYSAGVDPDEDNFITFYDFDELEEFLEIAEKKGTNEVEFLKRRWLIDKVELVAYTEEGVKELYKSGEVGHIINQLKIYGTIIYHDERSEVKPKTIEEIQKEFEKEEEDAFTSLPAGS